MARIRKDSYQEDERFFANLRVLNPDRHLLLLLRPPEHGALVQQLALDLLDLMPRSIERARQWSSLPATPEIDNAEKEKYLAGLELLQGALEAISARTRSSDVACAELAVADALDGEATRILDDSATLKLMLRSATHRLGKVHGPGFERAIRFTQEGALEKGLEQSEILREAKRELDTIAEDSESTQSEFVSYLQGAISLLLGHSPADAQSCLRRAYEASIEDADFRTYVIGQLWASVCTRLEDHQTAYAVAMRSLHLRTDFQSLWQGIRSAVLARREDDASHIFLTAVAKWPALMSAYFADDVLQGIAPAAFQAVVRSQPTLRLDAKSKLALWGDRVKSVRELRTNFSIDIPLIATLTDSRPALIAKIQSADLFTALAIRDHASMCAHDVSRLTLRTLRDEHDERGARVQRLRASLDQASSVRDKAVEAATQGNTGEVEKAREALRRALREGEKEQERSTWGLGLGCGGFVLYLVIAGILAFRGFQLGPTSTIGLLITAVAAIPFLRAIVSQISLGLRRASLESELQAKSKEAAIAYDRAKREAEVMYKKRVEELRDQLEKAEADAMQSESALRSMSESPIAA